MPRYIDIDDFRKNAYYADTDFDIGVYLAEHGCADVAPRAEVAREICCKIEEEIVAALESNYRTMREHNLKHSPDVDGLLLERIYGKIDALRGIEGFVEELKNKYAEGQK